MLPQHLLRVLVHRVAQLLEGFPLKGNGNVTVEPADPTGNATIELPGEGTAGEGVEPEDEQ